MKNVDIISKTTKTRIIVDQNCWYYVMVKKYTNGNCALNG